MNVDSYSDNRGWGGALKLAGLFLAIFAISALAQSAQYGTRIGQIQTVYLQDIPVTPGPTVPFAGPARIGELPARETSATSAAAPKAEFETWAEQRYKDYAESVVTGSTDIERAPERATVHRFVRDNFRNLYLTYTLTFEPIPKTDTFRVTFADSAVPSPVPQILRDGETIALTLAADPRTGRRLVDYVRVGTGVMHSRSGVSRDVYAEDAELTITKPRLRTNGIEQRAANVPATVSAPVVWVDIPGQGRYDLSFRPRADQGFERAGEVAENSLWFSLGGNIFRIDCADRIATGSGTYNIYARKTPSETPAEPAGFTFGAQR
jgi:hypothetical protein